MADDLTTRVDSPAPTTVWLEYQPCLASARITLVHGKAKSPPPGLWQPAFLDALSRLGNITRACEAAGILSGVAYYYRRMDAMFAKAWLQAYEEGVDRVEGVLQDAMTSGFPATRVTAAIFWLKGRRPSIFGDRVEHTGPGGGALPAPTMITEMRAALSKAVNERTPADIVDAVVVDKGEEKPKAADPDTAETNADKDLGGSD